MAECDGVLRVGNNGPEMTQISAGNDVDVRPVDLWRMWPKQRKLMFFLKCGINRVNDGQWRVQNNA